MIQIDEKLQELIEKAEGGDAESQYALGSGNFPELERNKERRYLESAAKQGHGVAQFKLGYEIFTEAISHGSRYDDKIVEGLNWLVISAAQGHKDACYWLGCFYLIKGLDLFDKKMAFKYFIQGAKLGDLRCQEQAIGLYLKGEVTKEHFSIFYEWAQSLEATYKKSYLMEFGKMFEAGDGVMPNHMMAFKCYFPLACKGDVNAMIKVSRYYRDGLAVEVNQIEAYIWGVLAQTGKNNTSKKKYIEDIARTLTTKERNKAQKEADKRHQQLLNQGWINLPEPVFSSDVDGAFTEPGDKETIKEEDDTGIESSNIREYKYLKKVKASFERELVEFELMIERTLTKKDIVDFTALKIRYDNKHTDKKSISLYQSAPTKTSLAVRRLMIKLAIQFSKPEDKRNEKIKNILKSEKPDVVSKLNKLFETIFPDCVLSNKNQMVNREKGELYIRLRIATAMVIKSDDYQNLDV